MAKWLAPSTRPTTLWVTLGDSQGMVGSQRSRDDWAQTSDLVVPNHAFYPLNYIPFLKYLWHIFVAYDAPQVNHSHLEFSQLKCVVRSKDICAPGETQTLNPGGHMLLRHTCISIPPQTHFITATLEFLDSAVNIVLSCPNQWWPCLKTYGCFKMMQRLRIAIPHLRSLSQWLSWSPTHSSF